MATKEQQQLLGKLYPPEREQVGLLYKIFTVTVLALVFQLSFFISLASFLYGALSLDYRVFVVLFSICLLQYKVKRSQIFIRLTNKLTKPLLYMKKFQKIYQEPIDPQHKSLFGFHPHSVMALGCLSNMNIEGDAMQNMVCLCSKFMLNIPFTGLLLRLWGIQSVDSNNLAKLMRQGRRSIGLYPGGFEEATLTTPKEMRIFIKERKGFIKYAIKSGYTIYPVLVMNEHKAYWTFDYLLEWRLLFNKIKMPGVFFFGPLSLFFRPDMEFVTVVGKGIKGKYGNSKQQIDRCHMEYMTELQRIYKKYNALNYDVPLSLY